MNRWKNKTSKCTKIVLRATLFRLTAHRVSVFLEEVASQTGIAAEHQHLLYLGHDLPLEGNMKAVNLPRTSPERPLILLSYFPMKDISLPFQERNTDKHLTTFLTFVFNYCI